MEPTPSNNSSENSNVTQNNPNQKPTTTTGESQVFGRSEYAKKEFWDERFAS